LAFASLVFIYRLGLRRLKQNVAPQNTTPPLAPGALSDAELDRYARHIVLRDIGGAGQKRLKQARVLVVGAGGLGSPVALYLAAAGVGTLGIIDDDTVEASNLQRQIAHTDDSIGQPKVQSAADRIGALNPFVDVRTYHRALTSDIATDLVQDYDVIVDGTDSYTARRAANDAAVAAGIPLVSGALGSWDGQVTVFDPATTGGCYACLYPNAPDATVDATCAATGVAAPLPGMIGSLMAVEVVKLITGAGHSLRGRMMLFDALGAEARTLTLAQNAHCPVCGPKTKE
ncbi:MAG: molybdopterin-synthase adenylyltransferase MoeB, partial [Pseudomonadota bacterium]